MSQQRSSSPQPFIGERECNQCPPWVVRCAHWDGRLITLSDSEVAATLHVCGYPFEVDRYRVNTLEESDWHPASCGCPLLKGLKTGNQSTFGDNFPSAEAEFYKREAALLGREATG